MLLEFSYQLLVVLSLSSIIQVFHVARVVAYSDLLEGNICGSILYIKTPGFFFLFFCCFFCLSELIEELASRRDTKIGMYVSNDESMIKFEDLSEMFTPRRDR